MFSSWYYTKKLLYYVKTKLETCVYDYFICLCESHTLPDFKQAGGVRGC